MQRAKNGYIVSRLNTHYKVCKNNFFRLGKILRVSVGSLLRNTSKIGLLDNKSIYSDKVCF